MGSIWGDSFPYGAKTTSGIHVISLVFTMACIFISFFFKPQEEEHITLMFLFFCAEYENFSFFFRARPYYPKCYAKDLKVTPKCCF